jgi:hypothetical protein
MTMESPPTVSFIHMMKGRGANHYQDFDAVVVVGREEPGIRTIEALARMRFPETAITPLPADTTQWPKRVQGYTMTDGRLLGVEVSFHPDPTCQSVLQQVREGEIVQIVDRLRGVNRTVPPSVFLLTNIPTEIPVDRLIPWRELLAETCGDQWWTEALKIGGGVAPLKADWLVAMGIFETKSAASQAVSRYVRKIRHQPNYNLISVLSYYRVLGQRGKASMALIAPGVVDAPAILASHVGEIAVFNDEVIEVEQQEPGEFEPEIEIQEEDIAAAPTTMSASNARQTVARVMELLPGRPVAREIDQVFLGLNQDSHVTQSDILLE